MRSVFRVFAGVAAAFGLMVAYVIWAWIPRAVLVPALFLLFAIFMGLVALTGRGLSKSQNAAMKDIEKPPGITNSDEDKSSNL